MNKRFKLGASDWTVNYDDELMKIRRAFYYNNFSQNNIIISQKSVTSELLSLSRQEQYLYQAVSAIIIDELNYTKALTDDFLYPFGQNLYQAFRSLQYMEDRIVFTIGAVLWSISYDDNQNYHSDSFGICIFPSNTIYLKRTENEKELTSDRVKDVMTHEIVHAVLDSMSSDFSNDETFVNGFALLFRQFLETIEDEQANTEAATTE